MIETQYLPLNFVNNSSTCLSKLSINSTKTHSMLNEIANIDDHFDEIKMAITDLVKLSELAIFGEENISEKMSKWVITSHFDYLKRCNYRL